MAARAKDYQVRLATQFVEILSGQTESSFIDLHGTSLVSIIMPAAFTGTVLRFKGSMDRTNFYDMYDGGGVEITADVEVDHYVCLNVPDDFKGVRYLKIVSNQSEGADRTVTLVLRY
jgi:hypothetical protein